jgi:hypothetical protein
MEVSFNKDQQPVSPAIEVPADVAPATVEAPTAPVTPEMSVPATTQAMPVGPSGMVLGDKIPDFKDIVLPRVNLVQNIGMMKDSFEPGSLVYGQTTVLFVPPKIDGKTQVVTRAATPPVIITVLGFRPTRYCEKVPGGGKGMIVDSEDAIRANGGTLDYNEWKLKRSSGMKRFETLADALVAIERPAAVADDDTVFNYQVGAKKYALGLWAMRGVQYTAAAKKVFFTARAIGVLRKGYPTRSFAVSSREEPFTTAEGKVECWIPICIPDAASNPEFLDFVRSIIG